MSRLQKRHGAGTAAILVVALALGLSACGRKGDPVAPVAATVPAETAETATPPAP